MYLNITNMPMFWGYMKRCPTLSSWSTCRTSVCASLNNNNTKNKYKSFSLFFVNISTSKQNVYPVMWDKDPGPNKGCTVRIPYTFGALFNWFSTPALFHRILFFNFLSANHPMIAPTITPKKITFDMTWGSKKR